MQRRTVIDADSIIHAVASINENNTSNDLQVTTEVAFRINTILKNTDATHYVGFIGVSGGTYRHKLAVTKPYKGNRPTEPSKGMKRWRKVIEDYMMSNFNIYQVKDVEADDCCISYAEMFSNVTIASNDKDLRQKAGKIYVYTGSKNRAEGLHIITEEEAELNLMSQMITGDVGDSISGLPGKGKVFLDKMLAEGKNLSDVIELYRSTVGDTYLLEQYELLRMKRDLCPIYPFRPVPEFVQHTSFDTPETRFPFAAFEQ